MLLCFLRHAEAEDEASSDFERPLTPKGWEQCEKVSKFCARTGLLPDLILHSPVLRAEQTAQAVAKKLGGIERIECPWLACGMRPEAAAEHLREHLRFSTLFVVGHEPDFSSTIAWLLGTTSYAAIRIRKASLTGLSIRQMATGGASLEFSVPVRLM